MYFGENGCGKLVVLVFQLGFFTAGFREQSFNFCIK